AAEVDAGMLGGGLWTGEVVEVFGPSGAGKTQLGLTVAAHFCASGLPVLFATAMDAPSALARRLRQLLCARFAGPPGVAERTSRSPELGPALDAALAHARVASVPDFAAFARLATACAAPGGKDAPPPRLLVVDGLAELLAPFATAQGFSHRWRLGWSARALRRLASEAGVRVLLLAHAPSPRLGAGAAGAGPLGQGAWASAASCRLELRADDERGEHGGHALVLRKSTRAAAGCSVPLVLGAAGVRAVDAGGPAPLGDLSGGEVDS
ncbi:unnamed protein product, partial [Prorocentrum cordatum]